MLWQYIYYEWQFSLNYSCTEDIPIGFLLFLRSIPSEEEPFSGETKNGIYTFLHVRLVFLACVQFLLPLYIRPMLKIFRLN